MARSSVSTGGATAKEARRRDQGVASSSGVGGRDAGAGDPGGTVQAIGLRARPDRARPDRRASRLVPKAIAALGHFCVYDLGGGLGIAYRPGDQAPSLVDYADATVAALHGRSTRART